MGLTWMLLAGAGIGVGLVIAARSLSRPHPPLAPTLARIGRTGGLDAAPSSAGRHRVLLSVGRAVGLDRTVSDSVRTDLRVLGRTPDAHMVRSVLTGIECGLLPPILTIILATAGIGFPVAVPAGLAVVGAVGGALLANVRVHGEAQKRRQSFKHALGAYLDLVSINLAAGRGVETALDRAARSGQGWMFSEIRQALYRAKVLGRSPWTGLDDLGTDIGVQELRELAASVGLAGDSGARVRASLAAKARTLRVRALGEIEESAQAANERMSLPVILLVMSFVIFIGFPATYRVVTGL
jgi:Flp pilus assembly protein TadB